MRTIIIISVMFCDLMKNMTILHNLQPKLGCYNLRLTHDAIKNTPYLVIYNFKGYFPLNLLAQLMFCILVSSLAIGSGFFVIFWELSVQIIKV